MTDQQFQASMEEFARTFEGIQHYCLRCRDKRTMTGVRLQWSKNGVPTAKGTCQTCGSAMNRTIPRAPTRGATGA